VAISRPGATLWMAGCLCLSAVLTGSPLRHSTGSIKEQAARSKILGPAYLLMELPSRRVVAESRADVLGLAIAPGSVIKIATLIAAMERGVVDETTRIMCRRTMTIDGRVFTCVHPDVHRPLSASEALGYSCNTFFAASAQRLPRAALDDVLVRMGIGPASGGVPTALAALGVSGIRATPSTLLDAFVKVTGPIASFRMPDRIRATVMNGLRLAATLGTASALGEAGIPALAKTGTAISVGGGVHGIVVAVTPDATPAYAIVVVVPDGAGSDAASVAATVLARPGIARKSRDTRPPVTSPPNDVRSGGALGEQHRSTDAMTVRVGIARRGGGHDRVSLSLESYVARVVAGEASPAAPASALQALAITVRTFAVANRGRHGGEGFDFCDLTHCQVLGRATREADLAAEATAGLVLRDGDQIARVFYSASCGGYTEAPSHVWPGALDAAYLPARPDAACRNLPAWTSEIAEPQLRRVLESAGLRGSAIRGFEVSARHPSGRVATLHVSGMAPDRIDANTFQQAAGRTLGWQVVKSTLFDIRRSGIGYRLTGRGVGHGVGLCVGGATTRATQGRSRAEILSAYFPGLQVGALSRADTGAQPKLASADEPEIRVLLPEADRGRLDEVRSLTRQLVHALASDLGAAPPPAVDLRFHPTVEAYTRATGKPWWTSARTAGSRIDLLPAGVLRQRGILDLTLRHELVHVLTDSVLRDRPIWVREGLAIVKSGELGAANIGGGSGQGATQPARTRRVACPSDVDFLRAASPEAWRGVYEAAGQCVSRALAAGIRWQDLR